MLEKRLHTIDLLDTYKNLLTDHQEKVMQDYYLQDLSLAEIAETASVSRQAVHDVIKRTEKSLEDYEKKLGILAQERLLKKRLDHIHRYLEDQQSVEVEYATRMLEKLIEDL